MTLLNYRKMYTWKWLSSNQILILIDSEKINSEEANYIKTGVASEGVDVNRIV